MKNNELDPCPFCGGEAELHYSDLFKGQIYYWIGCTECGIEQGYSCNTAEEAIELWNTRKG